MYYGRVTLPRIPSVPKLGMKSRIAQRLVYASVGSQGTHSHATQSSVGPRRQYKRSVGTAQYSGIIQYPRNQTVLRYTRGVNGDARRSNVRRVTVQLRAPVKQ